MDTIRDFVADNPKLLVAFLVGGSILYQFTKLLLATGAL